MEMGKHVKMTSVVIGVILCLGFFVKAEAAGFKVLVVMSYEKPEDNPWCREIKEGIESVLGGMSEIDYFYMNTKIDIDGGKQRAKEAYAMYKNFQYDGVIAADDNAQKMFVVPYLKNQVTTPVIFCGVNAKAEEYGYPATNVSGMLERGHFRESIAFIKQLMPTIQTVGFLVKDSPSGKALKVQIENDSETYLAKVIAFELVKTLSDITNGKTLRKSDAIFAVSLEGLPNKEGKPLGNKQIIPFVNSAFGRPLIGANNYHVESGALCAVVKTGQEQGEGAAEMLLRAMQGTPLTQLPIIQNFKGKRVINVTVMRKLGIEPKPISLLGATLIRTIK